MDAERAKRIREKTAVFGLGMLSDFCTVLDFITEQGISVSEIREYVDLRKREVKAEIAGRSGRAWQAEEREWAAKAPKCPECGAHLFLREICVGKGRGNLKGYRTCWYCLAGDCVYEDYSLLTVAGQLGKFGLGKNRRYITGCGKEG